MSSEESERAIQREELRQLVEVWRDRVGPWTCDEVEEGESRAYDRCADELEEAINVE